MSDTRFEAEAAALRRALEMAIDVRPELVDDFQAGPLIQAVRNADAGTALLTELTGLRIRVDTLAAIIRGASEQLGQGDVPLAVAIAQLRTAHMDAWKLIGRCDMALELIASAEPTSPAKRIAMQMRAEIKKASGK